MMTRHRFPNPLPALALLPLVLAGCATSDAGERSDPGYEIWMVDQSDSSPDGSFGGTLYIHDGADFLSMAETVVSSGETGTAADRPFPQARERVDLSGDTARLCREETGANPVRPHMLLFNAQGSHAVLAFVASGHVVLFDAGAREPLACFRMSEGEGGSRQAHAAFPTPDGRHVLVANQNGKLLERLDTDWDRGSFLHNTGATLDLARGTTPSGALREDPVLRPDNAPICPVVDNSGDLAWVTLRGGGLFVVDVRANPMRIVAEYDRETVRGNGCGGVQAAGAMYLNSGGAPVNLGGEPHPHLALHGFDVYRFPLSGYGADRDPNLPRPEVVFSSAGERDSHGMAAVREDRHVWVMDRHADVAEIFEAATGDHVNTVALNGAHTDNAAPDLVDVSPGGNFLYVALRGPTPLTGDPHNATGSTPGLGIIRLTPDGSDGALVGIVRITNEREGVEFADPHALRVRRK
ncbi:MAG: hypothetical protein EA350_01215 [Gemmatimonadales bacterium]|nr:MAG: hypothetical protein EA350_01215 [Gemmatimonadales bacterium]